MLELRCTAPGLVVITVAIEFTSRCARYNRISQSNGTSEQALLSRYDPHRVNSHHSLRLTIFSETDIFIVKVPGATRNQG